MSLQFILGGSGYGKTTYLLNKITREAEKNIRKQYFFMVPDQFTLQTQYDLVSTCSLKGIMNIDVVSMGRLAHRIYGETGGKRLPSLDDTGKNLIVRRVGGQIKEDIPLFGSQLDKTGYVHELKSQLSEFMQYGLEAEDLREMKTLAADGGRKGLVIKLQELERLYESFTEFIRDKYITTEENMEILSGEIKKSRLLKGAVMVIDGFTGFTPVQNKVIKSLLQVCSKVYITLTYRQGELFRLTWETMDSIMKMAVRNDIEIEEPVILKDSCRNVAEDISLLEKNLYQNGSSCTVSPHNINIARNSNIRNEVRDVICKIRREINENNSCYRDFAIVAGDLTVYRQELSRQMEEAGIPCFFDETRGIALNPFIEFIKYALGIIKNDFMPEDIYGCIKTGFTHISKEESDILELYLRETGIKGRTRFDRPFTRKTRAMQKSRGDGDGEEELAAINAIRLKLMDSLRPLLNLNIGKNRAMKVTELTIGLYRLMEINHSYLRLTEYEKGFEAKGNSRLASEYRQVYRATMELLEEVYGLLGEEELGMEEYSAIIEAGFQEIRLGSIPMDVDRIIVGDIERTRLKPVKYLFFMGFNENYVDKGGKNQGIISDIEREFLEEKGIELAPSPRKQLYIRRLYIYMTLSKPSERLYLSYSLMDEAGKSMRPSSLLADIKRIFPNICEEDLSTIRERPILTAENLKEELAENIRAYASGEMGEEYGELPRLWNTYEELTGHSSYMDKLLSNAFGAYRGTFIGRDIATLLYGRELRTSISRMENYASCGYSYFLRYGMTLLEGEEYGIKSLDLGNVYHGALYEFGEELKKRKLDWSRFSAGEAKEIVDRVLEKAAFNIGGELFFESKANRFILEKMKQILNRTVNTLGFQLRQGEFKPLGMEIAFDRREILEVSDKGKEAEYFEILGKIDRLDVMELDRELLVKIIDYKSSARQFSLDAFFHGIQLQMVIYMREALGEMQRKNPGQSIVPAAMLYYHIDDPIIDKPDREEDIAGLINKKLRTTGIINSREEIVKGLSKDREGDVIPVKLGKNGFQGEALITEEEMRLLLEYGGVKLRALGRELMAGNISKNPKQIKSTASNVLTDSCSFCPFGGVCGFDEHLPGYTREEIQKEDKELLLDKMREITKNEEVK